jgi:hypothetical protein
MPLYYHVAPGDDKSDIFGYMVDGNGALSLRLDYRGRTRCSTTPAPTVVVGPGAGTGATANIVAGSTDDIGTLRVVCGTSTLPASVIATITFHDPYQTPPFVQLQARDAVGAAAIYYVSTTTTQAVISTTNAPTASQTILVDYDFTGGQ